MSDFPPPDDPSVPSSTPATAYTLLPPAAPAPRPWLVIGGPITVQSSATLLVGLGMLVVGLAAGFLLRPLVPLPAALRPAAVANNPVAPTTAAETASSFKRFTPKARGSAGPIIKRNCHVRIILTEK